MLELVRRVEEKSLLERTNIKVDKVYILCDSFSAYVCMYPISKLPGTKQLSEELKKHKEFRIWYSSVSSEDLNTYYYLITQIYNNIKKPTIYVIDASKYDKNIDGILSCNEKEVEALPKYQKKLTEKEIETAITCWSQLEKENGDLRLIVNKKLVSISYEKIDKEILERLSKYQEISIQDFIMQELLVPNLYSIRDIIGTWDYLIKRLINQNKIRIVRREWKKGLLDYTMQVEIISIVK